MWWGRFSKTFSVGVQRKCSREMKSEASGCWAASRSVEGGHLAGHLAGLEGGISLSRGNRQVRLKVDQVIRVEE